MTLEQYFNLPAKLRVHLTPLAKAAGISLPKRAHNGDAGYDLALASCDVPPDTKPEDLEAAKQIYLGDRLVLPPGQSAKFATGLVFDLPTHENQVPWRIVMEIRPRTGLATKQGLYPMATEVDSGYRPEDEYGLTLGLRNLGTETRTYRVGDRVAQGVLIPVWTPILEEVPLEEIDLNTDRKGGRFGSTGT